MDVKTLLNTAVKKLSGAKISLPHLEAEILLSAILIKPVEFLLAHPEHKLTVRQISSFQLQIARRLKGEPIAHLTGHKEFYGLDFLVNKNVLVPRPETELMVEEAFKLAARNLPTGQSGAQHTTVIDVGTGSGCIIITLAKLLNYESRIMSYGLMATDISLKTLAVAKKNAQIHQVNKNIKFIKGNLLDPLAHNSLFIIHDSLIILANLPYGWKAWKNNCSLDSISLKFEPKIALFSDKNGLGLYEKLFRQIKELRVMSCGLRDLYALCEFDPRQTKLIIKLAKKNLPDAKLEIKKDLAGLNRLAVIGVRGKN